MRLFRQATHSSTALNRNLASLSGERFEQVTRAVEMNLDRVFSASQDSSALFDGFPFGSVEQERSPVGHG